MCARRGYSISSQQFPINLLSARDTRSYLGGRDREIEGVERLRPEGGERDASPLQEIASRLPAEKGDLRSPNRKFATAYALVRPPALYFHLRGANFEIASAGAQSSFNLRKDSVG